MRKYVLILLTLFCIRQLLYADCCKVTLSGSPETTANPPGKMKFFNNGACLGVVNTNNTITTYAINNCAFSTNATISSTNAANIAVSASNCIAIVNSNPTNTISNFTTSGCTLTSVGSAASDTNPTAIAFSPTGNCAVSTNSTAQSLTAYSVTGCSMTSLGNTSVSPMAPNNVAFSPFTCAGQTFFAVLIDNVNQVLLFNINNSTCVINSIGSITTAGSAGGQSIAFSPALCNGKILLAVDILNTGVQLFAIDPTSCAITDLGVTAPPQANYDFSTGFEFTPDGSCFISNDRFFGPTSSTTNIYSVNPTACTLSHTQSLSFGTSLTQGLDINPQGTCMAISFPGSSTINLYTFDTAPTVTITPSTPFTVCTGQSFSLTATPAGGSGTGYTFAWTGPNSFSATTQTITINNATPSNSGTYTVTVTDSNGCVSNSVSNTVTVDPAISVSIAPAIQVICPGQSVNFTATAIGGTGSFNYLWTGPNGFSESTGTTPSLTIANPTALNTGNYTVMVSDASGCQGTSSEAEVVVKSNIC